MANIRNHEYYDMQNTSISFSIVMENDTNQYQLYNEKKQKINKYLVVFSWMIHYFPQLIY